MRGSDWPFLRTPERIDDGTILALTEQLSRCGRSSKGVVGDPGQVVRLSSSRVGPTR